MLRYARRRFLFSASLAIALSARCQSWNKFWLDGNFTSFSFEPAQTRLAKSYAGVISGNAISVAIPYGPGNTSLAATFSAKARLVTVNGVTQQSGVTLNNFSSPVDYIVTEESGIQRTYTVALFQTTPVTDTGQTICTAGESGITPCPAAGSPGQDADYPEFPEPRSFQAQTINPLYPNDFFNIDTATGVTWKGCDEGQTGSTCVGGPTPLSQSVAATTCSGLNAANSGAGYGGRTDWRLPHFRELMQFQKFSTASVFADTALFPNSAAAANRWTSGLVLPASANAIVLGGNIGSTPVGSGSVSTRCVAGGSFPAPAWQDNGDGTIYEKRTGLTWQKCAIGQNNDATCSGTITQITWSNSLTACKNLTLAGKSWRLPNMNEIVNLIDLTRTSAPFVNATYFPGFPTVGATTPHFWTSTTLVSNDVYAYLFNGNGIATATIDTKNNGVVGGNSYHARCVSGP
ncbi:MAG: DUF1566 domain-containing protein [Turneriella sp.]|nr:DUF1566 domain-containing protein [Turneriella sp.]